MADTEQIAKDERNIPTPGEFDYTSVEIFINGSKVDNPAYNLRAVSVVKEANLIPVARITLLDGDTSGEKFAASESADFIPGNKIELKVGRDKEKNSVFKGVIIKHSIRANENGGAFLQLDCRDEAVS
ncbi:MAG TPA: hypothetical protein VJ720_15920, partial [Chitinophaga sp.]|nr:hypothetical protein [Chitinophaga sp.]